LTGELRPVAHADRRVAEAVKFGLGPVVGAAGGERLDGLRPAATVREALAMVAGKRRPVREAA
jgi:hypothetical protein